MTLTEIRKHDDPHILRLAIQNRAKDAHRHPGAKSAGGNTQRRLELWFSNIDATLTLDASLMVDQADAQSSPPVNYLVDENIQVVDGKPRVPSRRALQRSWQQHNRLQNRLVSQIEDSVGTSLVAVPTVPVDVAWSVDGSAGTFIAEGRVDERWERGLAGPNGHRRAALLRGDRAPKPQTDPPRHPPPTATDPPWVFADLHECRNRVVHPGQLAVLAGHEPVRVCRTACRTSTTAKVSDGMLPTVTSSTGVAATGWNSIHSQRSRPQVESRGVGHDPAR